MQFPLNFFEVSFLLAVLSLILLVTYEILSPEYGNLNIVLERKSVKKAGLLLGFLFLFTVIIRLYQILVIYRYGG